jgi:hypothetical protein
VQLTWRITYFLALAMLLVAAVLNLAARRNLSSKGREHSSRVYWLGFFADRSYFTDTGWRLFNWSIALCISAVLVASIVALIVSYF